MTDYEKALEYEARGLLKANRDHDLTLFCYSREVFLNGPWDEITKSHRGQLYCGCDPVNKPFAKIFNLNEVEETCSKLIKNKMKTEPYLVHEKANGHLFIVSVFRHPVTDSPQIVYHTKGSLNQNNIKWTMLADDIKMFSELYPGFEQWAKDQAKYQPMTLMFEAIVEYDRHTLYQQQVDQYGRNNTFVLLGVNVRTEDGWKECDQERLIGIANIFDFDQPRLFDKTDDLSTWFDDTDIEGYVIHFTNDNTRVKIKTKEYWTLRFKNDLSAERIMRMYRQAGETRVKAKLPEEVAEQILETIERIYGYWYLHYYVNISLLKLWKDDYDEFDHELIAHSTELTKPQKIFMFAVLDNKPLKFKESKTIRKEFFKAFLHNEELNKLLQGELEHIVDTINK